MLRAMLEEFAHSQLNNFKNRRLRSEIAWTNMLRAIAASNRQFYYAAEKAAHKISS